MSVQAEFSWALDEACSPADILGALHTGFAVQAGVRSTSTARYYDDADARLWRAKVLLWESDGSHFHLDEGGVASGPAVAVAGARFWWDFPAGAVRDRLRALAGVRALRPVATLQLSQTGLVLRNRDEKTVVRGRLLESTVDGQCLRYLALHPMRGYDAEFVQARACIKPLLRGAAALAGRALLTRHRIAALAPPRAAPMPISASLPTEQAVRRMAHIMLEQAQQHVAGVVADVDSEFLHAYRVNLRKTRSLLSLLKRSLPQAALDQLRPRVSAMAGVTNALRDLDVHLLSQHDYRALLPADFQAGMDELAERVERQRALEQRRVAAHLASRAYQADLGACLAELSRPAVFATPMAAKPVLPLVKRQLLKRYAAMAAQARLVRRDCADDDLHALRIEFKKLRYLIEFFADLLPRKRVNRLLGDIKQIQCVLGDFNDYSVQIAFMRGLLDQEGVAMARALNGLTAVLHVKKVAARERIFAAIDGYFTENRSIQFDLLFKTRKLESTQ